MPQKRKHFSLTTGKKYRYKNTQETTSLDSEHTNNTHESTYLVSEHTNNTHESTALNTEHTKIDYDSPIADDEVTIFIGSIDCPRKSRLQARNNYFS